MKKGFKFTTESREKMRNAKLGTKRPDMIGNTFKVGIKETDESKKKKSKYLKENPRKPWLGKKFSIEHRRKIGRSGEKNASWKGGITKENMKIRRSIESSLWREAVFARDNWTCQDCGIKGGELNAHHVKEFCNYPELRFAIDNGVTLCKKCHQKPEVHHYKFLVTKP
jgi:hypothetical protein